MFFFDFYVDLLIDEKRSDLVSSVLLWCSEPLFFYNKLLLSHHAMSQVRTKIRVCVFVFLTSNFTQ